MIVSRIEPNWTVVQVNILAQELVFVLRMYCWQCGIEHLFAEIDCVREISARLSGHPALVIEPHPARLAAILVGVL